MSEEEAIKRILAKNRQAKLTLEEAALLINADDSEIDLSDDEMDASVETNNFKHLINENLRNDIVTVSKSKATDLFDEIMIPGVMAEETVDDAENLVDEATLLAVGNEDCNEIIVEDNVEFEFIDENPKFKTTDKSKIEWRRRHKNSNRMLFEHTQYEEELDTSPYSIFARYIPPELFSNMVFFTNLYAAQQNSANYRPTTTCELYTFFGIQILMGTLKMPRIRMYFNKYISIQTVTEAMSHERFSQLRNMLHFVNNLEKQRDNQDKLYKVRPLIDSIRRRCLQHTVEEHLSIDEQIIPFKGQLSIKQYIKGKPCPWGIKVFLLCGKGGLPYDFVIYQGSTTEINKFTVKRLGFGSAIVLQLCERITTTGHILCFDNYFSSYQLFECLTQLQINAIGTIRINRFRNPPHIADKMMKKQGRGASDEVTSKDGQICVVKWQDNKVVYLASNFVGIGEELMARRYDKINAKYVQIKQPQIVQMYNMGMGGVDLFDQLLSYYRFFHKSRKWTLRVIAHFIDFAAVSSWIEYKAIHKKLGTSANDIMDLLNFRLYLAHCLTTMNQNIIRKRGRPLSNANSDSCNEIPVKKAKTETRPIDEIRYDDIRHLPLHSDAANRCKYEKCKGKGRVLCSKCKVHLCFGKGNNCFFNFHTKDGPKI